MRLQKHKFLHFNLGWTAWAVFPHYCTNREKNDQRFLKNNNCSLDALSGSMSSKIQSISPSSVSSFPGLQGQKLTLNPVLPSYNPGSSNSNPSPFASTGLVTGTVGSSGVNTKPVFSTKPVVAPSSVFSPNKQTASSFPLLSLNENLPISSNKLSFGASITHLSGGNRPQGSTNNAYFNHNLGTTFSPVYFTTTTIPTTTAARVQLASSHTTLRPPNYFQPSTTDVNTKSQLSSYLSFPSIFQTG